MRDIALILLLVGLIPISLARPFVAVCVFAWLSVMNPHRLTFGMAYDFNWAMLFGVVMTISAFRLHRNRFKEALRSTRLPLVFLLWTAITTAAAVTPAISLNYLSQFWKVIWAVLIASMCIQNSRQVAIFVAVITLSVGFYGVKGAPWMITTGGEFRLSGPAETNLSDNNHLAVGLLSILPLVYWLIGQAPKRWMRVALWIVIAGCLVSAIGTYSRGGFLTLFVLAAAFFVWSRRKAMALITLVPLVAVALSFMPDRFWDRMSTISSYQEDGSAQERLNSWRANFDLANSRPLGAGFRAYENPAAFAAFNAAGAPRVRAAHSIYFQVLGEHGWFGLLLFVTMLLTAIVRGMRARKYSELSDLSRRDFFRYAMLSILAYMTGGTFLNLAYWDVIWYLCMLVALVARHPEWRFDGVGSAAPIGVSRAPASPRAAFGAFQR